MSNKPVENKFKIRYMLVYPDVSDYLSRLIDAFSALKLDKSVWLTDREKVFFIAVIVNYLNGVKDHKSKKSDAVYQEVFGAHNKKERSIYLNKLQKKRWISYDFDEIEIPPFFRGLSLEGGEVELNVHFILEDNGRNDNRPDTPGNGREANDQY